MGGAAALTQRFRFRSAEGGKGDFGMGDNTNSVPEGASASSVLSP